MNQVEHSLIAIFILYVGHIIVFNVWIKRHPLVKKNIDELTEIMNAFIKKYF